MHITPSDHTDDAESDKSETETHSPADAPSTTVLASLPACDASWCQDPAHGYTNPAPSAAATDTAPSSSGGGLSTGSIIGLAVADGVALICLAAFLIWKFTRKRMSDLDDNENTKWPELNDHSGAGNASIHGSVGLRFRWGRRLASGVESLHDTYAVPPLPHLNPNQPYRDDPGAHYDPYHGPVPQVFNDAPQQEWGNEAIPMIQMAVAGCASPGPQAGRISPGPQAAYAAGRASPGPQAAYGGASGRMSPGPQVAYGL
ncbi:hypothetical protein FB45DRAFT_1049931 [Roridomyces roridus]|uniref:Uncharacterized protein n=1 Tax=Roridomyces roridus TaxID=1738132 RepID=A0AAD7CIG2_9AGAR|nr:hypothetical protein FB45DRAFT_1049931 [Roridomyces roridus]